ncbi:MAG: anti-sigma factor antagonist [Candidatus Cloacimonetes bacterium]|nr:anti-sigma factor antagonist [Candidatus Cloacimonadota bacterium]
MEIGYRFIGAVLVISFYGELHSEQAEAIEIRVKELVKQSDKIIINCIDLEYLDSKGLGTLIKINTFIKEQAGELVLCSVGGKVKKVFELTRFYDYMKIFKDIDEACKYYKG